jgi:hypothetical protein
MYPKRLSGKRDLANLLCCAGFRRDRHRGLQQLGPVAGCDCQLEAREKDADDHDRTDVRMAFGRTCLGARFHRVALPNPAEIAMQGVRTLRAFGQRVPGAGSMLAPSLHDAVEDRIVLITGASSGIGKATAIELGKAGASVLLVARTETKLEEVKRTIEGLGGTAHVHRCDLSDLDDIDRMTCLQPTVASTSWSTMPASRSAARSAGRINAFTTISERCSSTTSRRSS